MSKPLLYKPFRRTCYHHPVKPIYPLNQSALLICLDATFAQLCSISTLVQITATPVHVSAIQCTLCLFSSTKNEAAALTRICDVAGGVQKDAKEERRSDCAFLRESAFVSRSDDAMLSLMRIEIRVYILLSLIHPQSSTN
jgi:hypothetical protein